FFAPNETVGADAAVGRISAELVAPYPPGVPVLAPGEIITAEALAALRAAQGSLPGEYGQPVHRGPDGELDAVAAPPVEYAGVDQLVEHGAEMIQGCALRPGPVVGGAVVMPRRQGERGCEQARFLAGEPQVGRADRVQPADGGGGIAVPAAHAR